MKQQNQIPVRIQSLIIDFLKGSITVENERKLHAWIHVNKENRQVFKTLKTAWLLLDNSDYRQKTESEWGRMHRMIKERQPLKARRRGQVSAISSWRGVLRIAAIVTVFYILGYLTFHFLDQYGGQSGVAKTEIISPLGSRVSVSLPDGTKVDLNAGSILSYGEDYGRKERGVYLEGEGFFSVARNDKKPFRVRTSTIEITALGTAFNVKAYEEEETVQTTLVEGMVRIADKNNLLEQVYLRPNQMAVYHKQEERISLNEGDSNERIRQEAKELIKDSPSVRVSGVDPKPVISWKDEQWLISHEQLGSLAKKLERRYDVTIVFDEESVNKYAFSGTLKDETLEQVLNVIKLTAPVEYEIEHKQVRIWANLELAKKYEQLLNDQ